MAKQSINVGTTANDKKGDSLRLAFQKVNANFTELYTALGLDSGGLNLGAFEFTGSTISTTDSSGITIDQATTVTSDLTVGGDILPNVANGGDLGSLAKPWRSLYVSNNTVFLGGVPLSLEAGTNELKINNVPISQTLTYADIPNVPTDLSDLTDTGNLLSSGGADTGDITFSGVKIQGAGTASGDGNGYSTIELVPDSDLYNNDQYLIIDPTAPQHIHIRAGGDIDASGAELYLGGELNYVRVVDDTGVRLQNRTRNNTFYNFVDPTDFNTATWFESAGTYFVQYTAVDAEIGNLAFTIGNDNENTVTVYYGGGSSQTLTYDSSSSNLGGGVYRFSVVEAPPVSPTVLTAMDFEIWTNRTNSVVLSSNDFEVSVTDDLRLTGSDTVSLRNRSTTEPVSIVTDYDNTSKTWQFGTDGSLTAPGDIIVSGDITGTSGASTLYLKARPDSNTYIQLNNSVDSVISTVANLEIRTDVSNTAKTWEFDTTGNLTFPDSTVQTTAYTGPQTTLVGATIAAVGGTASANETGITYLSGGLSKWAIFTEGAFTVGVWDNVQIGWTVTDNNGFTDTIAGRGAFGTASFQTTVNNWPAPASGKTYVFTSPDYQPASVSPVEISVGNNDWTFDNNGGLTLPTGVTNNGRIINDNGISLKVDSSYWTFGTDGALTIPGDIQSDNDISITVDSGDSSSYTWNFGETGDLTLPSGGSIVSNSDFTVISEVGGTSSGVFVDGTDGSGNAILFATNNAIIRSDNDGTFKDWTFGTDGDLSLPSGGLLGQVWGDGIDTELTLKSPPGVGDSGYVALSSANERNYVEVSNIGIVLGVEFGQAGFKKLTFGTDGNLKSADGEPLQILSTGAGGAVSLAWSSSLDSPENIALVIANSPGAQTSGAVDIVVGAIAGPNIWTFDPSGALTIPGDIQSENDISVRINLEDSTQRTWRFGEDGNLTFPETILGGSPEEGSFVKIEFPISGFGNTAGTIGTGPLGLDVTVLNYTWGFNLGAFDGVPVLALPGGGKITELEVGGTPTIILEPADAIDPSQKLLIKGGQAEEPHLHLTTGDLRETAIFLGTDEHGIRTTVDGGVIINTYDYATTTAQPWVFSDNGIITFPDSTEQTTAWTGVASRVESEDAIEIKVNLTDSTTRIWRFGEDGILNLPDGGDIVDSTGTSVLGGGGGGSVLEEPFESKTSATGVIEHDATTNRLFYHTSITANFTANFTNLGLAANEATSISLVLVQGATARMVTAVQIGGSAQTITWQGSASAPQGNANRTDVVTFSILCTATDTYTVLGMLTSFGG